MKPTDIQQGDQLRITDRVNEWQVQGTVSSIRDNMVTVRDRSMRTGFEISFTELAADGVEVVLLEREA